MRFFFLSLVVAVLMSCATDPESTQIVIGGAACRYEDCEGDIVASVSETRTGGTVFAVFIARDAAGKLASSVQSGDTLVFPESLTVTATGFTASLTSTSLYETFKIFRYVLTGTGTLQGVNVSLSATATLDRAGNPTRYLNGNGTGQASSGGGGGSTSHYVFVTSTSFGGNMGGLSGADSSCLVRGLAGTASGPLASNWKAILSDESTSAISRLNLTNGAVKNMAGTTVANSGTTLFDSGTLAQPVDFNENGGLESTSVWTGSTEFGAKVFGATCDSWTQNSFLYSGNLGTSDASNSQWVNANTQGCNSLNRLYCISE